MSVSLKINKSVKFVSSSLPHLFGCSALTPVAEAALCPYFTLSLGIIWVLHVCLVVF